MIISTRHFSGANVRHVDQHGRPICGANPRGALVVDDARQATCPDCRLIAGQHLKTKAVN